jgi:hypothetical protein
MKSGAANSFITAAMFGPAIDPGNQKGLDAMDKHFSNIGYGKGRYSPVYRSGGVFGAVHRFVGKMSGWDMSIGGISLGRNLLLYDDAKLTLFHETSHYYQQIFMGYGQFYGDTFSEYLKFGNNTYLKHFSLDYNADRWGSYYRDNF